MSGLFDNLPQFPVALPDEDLRFLASLPEWPTQQEVYREDETVCRRLERRGLVRVSRQKDGPDAMFPTWYAGKLPAAEVRAA